MKNSGDSVFGSIPVGDDEPSLFGRFLVAHDFSLNTRKAMVRDMRKFARWFSEAHQEPFTLGSVTVRDVTDFRDHLRRNLSQAVEG